MTTKLNTLISDLSSIRATAFGKESPEGSEGLSEKERQKIREEAEVRFNRMIPEAAESLLTLIQDTNHYNRNAALRGIAFTFAQRLATCEAKLSEGRRQVEAYDARIEAALEAGETPDAGLLGDFDAAVRFAKTWKGYRDGAQECYEAARQLYEAVTAKPFDYKPKAAEPQRMTKKDILAMRAEAKNLM